MIYNQDLEILLLERQGSRAGLWQSVTGGCEEGELPKHAAWREVEEETGFTRTDGELADWQMCFHFEIMEEWRHRYQPGVHFNTEHVFSLMLSGQPTPRLAKDEHCASLWLPHMQAKEKAFSWTNAAVIDRLPEWVGRRAQG